MVISPFKLAILQYFFGIESYQIKSALKIKILTFTTNFKYVSNLLMLPLVVGTSKKLYDLFMSPLGHHFFLGVF